MYLLIIFSQSKTDDINKYVELSYVFCTAHYYTITQ